MSEQSSSPINTIIFIAICLILVLTNPSQETHIKEVNNLVKKVVNSESSKGLMDNSNSSNQIMSGLGLLFGDGIVEGLSDKFISRKNLILFSLTNVSFNGTDKVIGLGILGNVIIFDGFETQLKGMLNKKDNNEYHGESSSNSNNNALVDNNKVVDSNQTFSNNNPNRSTDNSILENTYYTVIASQESPVHFYTTPNYSDMRNSYFDTQERVYVYSVSNGFAYIEFTNSSNQTSKGWIPVSSLEIQSN